MTILTLKGLFPCYHGDVIQLVSSRYCVIILCVLAACHVITVSLYYRPPIRCFCPVQMTSLQCDTISSSCLSPALSTVYQFDKTAAGEQSAERRPVQISGFYQFASLLLLLQAALFYAPCVVAREWYRAFGIQLDELALSALEARRSRDRDDRQAAVGDVAAHINAFCVRRLRQRHASYALRTVYAMRISLVHLATRLVYVADAVGQFYLLDSLLGLEFHSLGWTIVGRTLSSPVALPSLYDFLIGALQDAGVDVGGLPEPIHDAFGSDSATSVREALANLSVGVQGLDAHLEELETVRPGDNSTMFPSEITCQVLTQQMGNTVAYSVHCILPLNQFNEIVFEYVWFLLLAVALVGVVSALGAILRLLLFPCQRGTIRYRLHDLGVLDDVELDDVIGAVDLFEREFLGVDGTLLLSYVEAGSGDVISDVTLASLWELYTEQADNYDALYKRPVVKESVVEDVVQIPTRRPHHPDEGHPLKSVFDPMQPPEAPPLGWDSAAPYSRETAFSKPFDAGAPPEYLPSTRPDTDKLGSDDDFMV